MPRRPKPHRVDVHVGGRLRTRRALFGLSQATLAKKFGITFQQLQNYESGANRMSAGRIWQVSRTLGVSVSYFFEGLDEDADPAADILNTRAGLELVRDVEGCSEEVQEFASLLCKAAVDEVNAASGKKAKSARRRKAK